MENISSVISNDFFREEIRNGFTVTQDRKQLWAVQLDLLCQLQQICKKYNLTAYAAYGTLLGAVRHDGFIPWDDDIDVMMTRCDYEKLCDVAGDFFEPYFFQTEYTDIGFARGFARLRNSNTTAIQKYESVDGKSYVRYNQGIFIDIFPLDNVPDDEEQRKLFALKAEYYKRKAINWSTFSCRYIPGQSSGIKEIVKKCLSPILRFLVEKLKIYNPYIRKYEKHCTSLKNTETENMADLWFYDVDKDSVYPKSLLQQSKTHKFEMFDIDIPNGSDAILEKLYGDWKKFIIGATDHGELFVDVDCSYWQYMRFVERSVN